MDVGRADETEYVSESVALERLNHLTPFISLDDADNQAIAVPEQECIVDKFRAWRSRKIMHAQGLFPAPSPGFRVPRLAGVGGIDMKTVATIVHEGSGN
jgi:hypothetical protein